MRNTVIERRSLGSEAGVTLVEVLLALLILLITSVSLMGIFTTAIALNHRNKVGSTGAMLAQAVVEQIKATVIGSGSSAFKDCDGTTWTIDTIPDQTSGHGAAINGASIDFTQASPPTNYHMNYVVKSPCQSSGTYLRTYDVRWNLHIVGGASNTYLVTVGARLLNHSEGNLVYPEAVNYRVMAGN